jgi:hypothetical protein
MNVARESLPGVRASGGKRKKIEKVRHLTVKLTNDMAELLESIEEQMPNSSIAEIVRESLRLRALVAAAEEIGARIMFEAPDTGERYEVSTLLDLRHNRKKPSEALVDKIPGAVHIFPKGAGAGIRRE